MRMNAKTQSKETKTSPMTNFQNKTKNMKNKGYLIRRTLETKRRYNNWNKTYLYLFLGVILCTLFMRIMISVFLDVGFFEGKAHIGFWSKPSKAFDDLYQAWLKEGNRGTFDTFLKSKPEIQAVIDNHPNIFWTFTQFTWLTFIGVLVLVVFRLFKYENKLPKWLKWIMTQRTLTLMTVYEIIIATLFWSAIFNGTIDIDEIAIRKAQIATTSLVHGVVPFMLVVYSLVFIIKDKQASLIRDTFAFKGMIWPCIYAAIYLLFSIIWIDPYPVSHFHNALVGANDGVYTGTNHWIAWLKKIWIVPIGLILFYIVLGLFNVLHNWTLLLFNKNYKIGQDYEAKERYEKVLLRVQRKIFKRAYGKGWKTSWRKLKK